MLPQPSQEAALEAVRQVDTLNQLGKPILGARLDDELFQLLNTPISPAEQALGLHVESLDWHPQNVFRPG